MKETFWRIIMNFRKATVFIFFSMTILLMVSAFENGSQEKIA